MSRKRFPLLSGNTNVMFDLSTNIGGLYIDR